MIHGLYDNILFNLVKVNNRQLTKISTKELKLIERELKTVYKKTTTYATHRKRIIKSQLNECKKNENKNVEIIKIYKDELKSLEEIESTLDIQNTLELFVNIDSFLSSIVDNPQMLKEVNIKNITDLISALNDASIIEKEIGNETDPLFFDTEGTSGKPDNSIVEYIDGKWMIDFIAASNSPEANYESIQLFLHPFSLQRAYDVVSNSYPGDISKLSAAEVSKLVGKEYNDNKFTLENINEFFDYILDKKNRPFLTNVKMGGAYSNNALLFLKEHNQSDLIEKFIKDKILTEANKFSEIEEISNWIMMNGQLASIFELIDSKTRLNEEEVKEKDTKELDSILKNKKERLEKEFVGLIKHMTSEMTYTSSVSTKIEKKKFDEKFNNDEWIHNFFTSIIEHSTEDKPVISPTKSKNNFSTLLSFIHRGFELSSFDIEKLGEVFDKKNHEVIAKSQTTTIKHEGIISDAKTEIIEEYKEKLFNFEEVKGIPNKLSPEYEELSMDIKILLDNNPDNFTNKFFTIMNNKAYNIDYINFLNIMKKVGELPNTIDPTIKQDIENIINIFENLESILGITIKNSQMKILFNDILKNSFEDKIISYDTFIDNLSTKLLEIYDESSSTVFNKSIRALNNNLTLTNKEDSKKLLSKTIRERAQNKMKTRKEEGEGLNGDNISKENSTKPPIK